MKRLDLLESTEWQPFSSFNLTHSFFNVNSETLTQTWVVLGVIFILSVLFRLLLNRKNSVGRFLITSFAQSFLDLSEQTLGYIAPHHFYFITSLFIFILVANIISLIPGLDEPTQDLNTTLALGVTSFLYIQFYAIKKEGFGGYLKSYFSPFFLMLPLNVIGKFASIISISFRLFGNIFGGAIISKLYVSAISGSWLWELFGIFTGLNFIIILFFGIFEGFLQAFVFAMLTITYLSIAIKGEEPIIGDVP